MELEQKYKYITYVTLEFKGEKKSMAYILGLYSHKDRTLRKLAHDTINDYLYKTKLVRPIIL